MKKQEEFKKRDNLTNIIIFSILKGLMIGGITLNLIEHKTFVMLLSLIGYILINICEKLKLV